MPDQVERLKAEVARLQDRVAELEQGERGRLEELRQSQALYRALVETSFAGICITDPDENIVYANPALAEIMGYEPAEIVGLNLSAVAEPLEFERFQYMTQQRRQGLRNSFESVVFRKGGETINVLLSAAPLWDAEKEYSGCLTVVVDITQLRQAQEELARTKEIYTDQLEAMVQQRSDQLEETQRQLIQAEKLAAVGRLGAGVAHEINNPAGVLLLKLRFLLSIAQAESLSPRAVATLNIAIEQVERITRITRSLLDFSRPAKLEAASVDLTSVVSKALELAKPMLKAKSIAVEPVLADALPPVAGNSLELEQVLFNLIDNAIFASGPAGRLLVETGAAAGEVWVKVSDWGTGIDPKDLDRIFEPFFTTKDIGQGIGLGLAISYGIVEGMGGRIAVESSLGRGTQMAVILPQQRVQDLE